MKYKYILFLLLIIIIPINKIYADCIKEEENIERFKREFKVTYEFVKEASEYGGYILTIYNPDRHNYKYKMYKDKDTVCNEENEYYTKCYYYMPGEYIVDILSTSNTCKEILTKIYFKLPYNIYSKDPVCSGIEDFVLCDPTYDKEIDYETFLSRVEVYKQSIQQQDEDLNIEPIDEIRVSLKDKIMDFIIKNIFIIVTIIIAIILLIILIVSMIKNYKEKWRLE